VTKIPFYVTSGSGVLLLGNEVLHKSHLLGPENLLVILSGVRNLSKKELTMQTYSEPMSADNPDIVSTYLSS